MLQLGDLGQSLHCPSIPRILCGECVNVWRVNVWRVNVWSVWDACVNVWVGRHDALPSLFLRLEDWETWDLEKGHAQ